MSKSFRGSDFRFLNITKKILNTLICVLGIIGFIGSGGSETTVFLSTTILFFSTFAIRLWVGSIVEKKKEAIKMMRIAMEHHEQVEREMWRTRNA